tara:strand:+ start:9986 stop:10735 length:750 start_codon:yes stop_codon:yes gene_type:complete
MINSVRNTVLAILNKNNYGYISPADFNLYAEQAQLDLFENYFYDYNYQINKENARQSGTGYANIKQQLGEVIDIFTVYKTLVYDAPTLTFTLPTDWYTLLKIELAPVVSPATFTNIERVSLNKISKLLMSNLTAPSTTFPAYTLNPATSAVPQIQTNSVKVYPLSITSDVRLTYIRYPRVPKWTFNPTLVNGQPVFSSTQADYVDFELPSSDQTNIIRKILEYAGMSIREIETVDFANQQFLQSEQAEQ